MPDAIGHDAVVGGWGKWWVLGLCIVIGPIVVTVVLDESGLDALRSDPMAIYELPTAITTRSSESGGSSGFFSFEDTPATVRRSFTVPTDEAEAAMAQIAAAARDAGWEVSDNEYGGYSGDKEIGGKDAHVSIAGIVSDDIVWFELSTRD